MTNPKYTFLLPAYKAKFFAEALESIKNQTYKDFVCLVSDDCSPEDLKSIFDEIVGDDTRFTFRRNAENMGGKSLVSHWNLLIDMCDTEFLIMASDDDVYEHNFLYECDILLKKYKDINLVRGRVKRIDAESIIYGKDTCYEEKNNILEFLQSMFTPTYIHCIANFVFRTNKLKEIGGFVDYPLAWYSDDATIVLMAKDGMINTNAYLFKFRTSIDNISNIYTVFTATKKIQAAESFYEFICDFIKEIPTNDNLSKFTKGNVLMMMKKYVEGEMLSYNYYHLSLYDLYRFYRWLHKRNFICGIAKTFPFFYNWIRYKTGHLMCIQ